MEKHYSKHPKYVIETLKKAKGNSEDRLLENIEKMVEKDILDWQVLLLKSKGRCETPKGRYRARPPYLRVGSRWPRTAGPGRKPEPGRSVPCLPASPWPFQRVPWGWSERLLLCPLYSRWRTRSTWKFERETESHRRQAHALTCHVPETRYIHPVGNNLPRDETVLTCIRSVSSLSQEQVTCVMLSATNRCNKSRFPGRGAAPRRCPGTRRCRRWPDSAPRPSRTRRLVLGPSRHLIPSRHLRRIAHSRFVPSGKTTSHIHSYQLIGGE